MKIGVNYLLESKGLFEEGKIDFVDYFKLYGLNDDLSGIDWCVNNKGFMFHGSIGYSSYLGDENIVQKMDLAKTKDVLEKSIAPYMSGHIYSNEVHTLDEYYENFKNNIKSLQDNLQTNIVLENIPYRKSRSEKTCLIRPEVISKIVYDNDVQFLFDISHARRSAIFLGMSLEEYFSKLPMDRCVEVHLAGMFHFPNVNDNDNDIAKNYSTNTCDIIEHMVEKYGPIYDYHGKMDEEDYGFLEKMLKDYPQIEYVTLEYGSYNASSDFKDEDYPYPVCNYNKVNPLAKEEILEQLLRINKIVKGS